MLDGVHVDLTSQQVVALAIKPAFKPLFKAWLDNDDDGGKSPRLALGKIDELVLQHEHKAGEQEATDGDSEANHFEQAIH